MSKERIDALIAAIAAKTYASPEPVEVADADVDQFLERYKAARNALGINTGALTLRNRETKTPTESGISPVDFMRNVNAYILEYPLIGPDETPDDSRGLRKAAKLAMGLYSTGRELGVIGFENDHDEPIDRADLAKVKHRILGINTEKWADKLMETSNIDKVDGVVLFHLAKEISAQSNQQMFGTIQLSQMTYRLGQNIGQYGLEASIGQYVGKGIIPSQLAKFNSEGEFFSLNNNFWRELDQIQTGYYEAVHLARTRKRQAGVTST